MSAGISASTAIIGGMAAGSVASGIMGAGAAGDAANAQANAANAATQAQLKMFDQVMGNLKPYQDAGSNYLSQLGGYMNNGPGGLLHNFNASDLNSYLSPNYNFQLAQGMGTLQNQAAASGGAMGGNALSGMQAYAQNYAGNSYQNAFQNYLTNQNNVYGRLGSLAQLGESASTGQASGAPTFSQGISNSIMGAGNAQAAGIIGSNNAITGAIGNLSNIGMLYGAGNGWFGNIGHGGY